MKVVLIKPYNVSDHIQPALGLGYLATALRPWHAVTIIDGIKEKLEPEQMDEVIRRERPDVIGWQLYTFDLAAVRAAMRVVKRVAPRIVTLVGGPHPSTVPRETLDYFGPELDFAFRGEAEVSLRRFLDGDPHADIPGLVWRDGGEVRANPVRFVEDLDRLGQPAWDLIRPETYPEAQHGAFFRKFPIAPIMITRGCPYQCTFCAGNLVAGRTLRFRSVEHVLEEIQYLYRERGIREFHVVDDNFTLRREYTVAFLRRLRELNLDISWATPNGIRMDSLDDEVLELMKATGLYLISLGIESGTDRVLTLMKKGLTVAKIRTYTAMIARHGIEIAGFFILGFPTETAADMEATVTLSLELPLLRANYFTYLPFPGTESYRELEAAGELAQVDWDRFYFMNAAYTPRGISREELKAIQRRAFLRFYFRPRIFWRNVRGIKSVRHFGFLLRRFFHWLVMK